jgi:hypothetical protein
MLLLILLTNVNAINKVVKDQIPVARQRGEGGGHVLISLGTVVSTRWSVYNIEVEHMG